MHDGLKANEANEVGGITCEYHVPSDELVDERKVGQVVVVDLLVEEASGAFPFVRRSIDESF